MGADVGVYETLGMIDIELYGGKRGFIEHLRARGLYAISVHRQMGEIDWAAVTRLAFVCKGNICRSPYAAARARSLGVPAVSFGLDAVNGTPADPAASRNALVRGVDLSKHRSTRVESSASFADGDLVVVFELGQITEVRRRGGERIPLCLLGVWTKPLCPYIQDPYGRSDRYFQRCYSLIDANVSELVRRMVRGGSSVDPAGRFGSSEPTKESCNRKLP